MKILWVVVALFLSLAAEQNPYANLKELKLNSLSEDEARVILHKGTERPFSGKYYKHKADGMYVCKQCGAPLYASDTKFDSGCGWPSFDDALSHAIKRTLDADGRRVEITCAKCGAHLGHVFEGEGFTKKNTRYCVNSISLDFVPKESVAYFAGGCFWGVEYYFEQLKGVLHVESGFMGGHLKNPSYKQVVRGDTGHYEVVAVYYDPKVVSYEALAKLFFEIHDATQKNGQGPDIGERYLSAVFTSDAKEQEIAKKLIAILQKKGLDVATKIYPASEFYKAEEYHQDYYKRHNKKPYCHAYKKLF